MQLKRIEGDFSICKLGSLSELDRKRQFFFASQTDEEISLVCLTKEAPEHTLQRDDGWRAFRIQGVLDFSMIGVLAEISSLLAENGIGIFVVSTYNTDYVLTKEENYEKALAILAREGGYSV